MDNKQYITRLSRRATLNYKETQQLVASTITVLTDVLCQNDSLAIPAFGSFASTKKDEYIDYDPQSGQRMLYPPRITVDFTAGTILSKNLSHKSNKNL